jgi:leucyl-tRNA synthetase
VQINGKVRGRVEIEKGSSEKIVKEKVLKDDKISTDIKGKDIKRFIYIEDKIVNIVL